MIISYPLGIDQRHPLEGWSEERRAWLMAHLTVLWITEEMILEVETHHPTTLCKLCGKPEESRLRVLTTKGWIERSCVLPIPE